MTVTRILLDAWLVVAILSLASVAGIGVGWMLVSVATLVSAARRNAGRTARLGSLGGRLDESGLVDIDEAFERILAEEFGSLSGGPGVSASFAGPP